MMTYSIPGIYNALDPVMGQPGMKKTNSGIQNAQSLQATIQTAINAGGGIVLVPAADANYATGPYAMSSPGAGMPAISIPSNSPPLLILGTGLGTALLMETSGDVFDVNGSGSIFFQDLVVQYRQSPLSPLTGTAFNFIGGEFYGMFRVSIIDCENPIALSGDQIYVLQCAASYTSSFPAGAPITAVSVLGAEAFIAQCVFAFTGSPSSNQRGIVVGDATTGSSYTRVVDTEIQNFYTGITLATTGGGPTNKGSMFTNVRVLTPRGGVGLSLQPNIYDARFISCDFENITAGTAKNIVVGPVGGGNQSIDTVIFDACSSTGSTDYGLEIAGGFNIQVNGGAYSGNTTAGIGITGAASEIQINGANCIGPSQGGSAQQYGISINPGSGVAVSDVQLIGVNCSGTGTSGNGAGIYINGSAVSDVRIEAAICEGSVFGNASQQQYGVYVAGASGVIVAASTLSGSSAYGLYLSAVTNVTVSATDLSGNTSGGASINGGATQSQYVLLRNCNVTGYPSGSAIAFSGTLTKVEVTNSAGYNDQGTSISTTPPASGHLFHAYDAPYSYYGPVVFYTSGGQTIQIAIDGHNTNLIAGSFTLGPGDSAMLTYTSLTGPTFTMIGE
jgi:hypothetical protein